MANNDMTKEKAKVKPNQSKQRKHLNSQAEPSLLLTTLNPKQKSVSTKAIKSEKSKETGYILPKVVPLKQIKSHDRYTKIQSPTTSNHQKSTKFPCGYEMVKVPQTQQGTTGKQSGKASSADNFRDDKSKRKKNLCIIYCLVISGCILCIVFSVGIAILVHNSSETKVMSNQNGDLPNLNGMCRQVRPKTFHSRCFYHANSYPVNCSWTDCQSVLVKYSWSSAFNFEKIDKVNNLTSIANLTPCDDDKWCVDGKCVTSGDERIKAYSNSLKKVDGSFEVTYSKDDICFDHIWRSYEWDRISKCVKKNCNFKWENKSNNWFRLGFRSCTNPYPSNGGKSCWESNSNDPNIIPIVVVNCTYCDNFVKPVDSCTKTLEHSKKVPQAGYPCKAKNYSGVCFKFNCYPKMAS